MKSLALTILLILGIQQDKIYHFVAGASACAVASFYEPDYCIGASIGVGLLKELWDIQGSGFDWKDLSYTAGGGFAWYVVISI